MPRTSGVDPNCQHHKAATLSLFHCLFRKLKRRDQEERRSLFAFVTRVGEKKLLPLCLSFWCLTLPFPRLVLFVSEPSLDNNRDFE